MPRRQQQPAAPKTATELTSRADRKIVRTVIHPAIGITRIGDSRDQFCIGP